MKAEFDSILAGYGHDVLLQRSSDPGVLERHTVRFNPVGARGLANAWQQAMPGVVNGYDRIYYFKSEVEPHTTDLVYEINDPTQFTIWNIDVVEPMRGESGHIIYWLCACTRIRPN